VPSQPSPGQDTWLAALQHQIPVGASILDLGCGCGVPVAAIRSAHTRAVLTGTASRFAPAGTQVT